MSYPRYDSRRPEPPWLTRIWRGALLILGAALAVWVAVQLIVQIWLWLLLIATVIAAGVVGFRWWQSRRDRW
jgi:hypothetical protein